MISTNPHALRYTCAVSIVEAVACVSRVNDTVDIDPVHSTPRLTAAAEKSHTIGRLVRGNHLNFAKYSVIYPLPTALGYLAILNQRSHVLMSSQPSIHAGQDTHAEALSSRTPMQCFLKIPALL